MELWLYCITNNNDNIKFIKKSSRFGDSCECLLFQQGEKKVFIIFPAFLHFALFRAAELQWCQPAWVIWRSAASEGFIQSSLAYIRQFNLSLSVAKLVGNELHGGMDNPFVIAEETWAFKRRAYYFWFYERKILLFVLAVGERASGTGRPTENTSDCCCYYGVPFGGPRQGGAWTRRKKWQMRI